MSGECFICDQRTNSVLTVGRFDGTTYDVPMCVGCLTETSRRAQPIRLAHELIDARNEYRRSHSRVAA
jgi:hypothetical protein